MPEYGNNVVKIIGLQGRPRPEQIRIGILGKLLFRFKAAEARVNEQKIPPVHRICPYKRRVAQEIEHVVHVELRGIAQSFQAFQSHSPAVHQIIVQQVYPHRAEALNALFADLVKKEIAGKKHLLMIAEYEFKIRLLHHVGEQGYAAVAVAVYDVAQNIEIILIGEADFFKQSLEFFKRIAVQVGYGVGAHFGVPFDFVLLPSYYTISDSSFQRMGRIRCGSRGFRPSRGLKNGCEYVKI